MKAMILYESFFGNTEQVAQAMGVALGATADVTAHRIADVDATALPALDLLVVGSATRAFRPSPDTSAFLARLPGRALGGVTVAAFDTRIAPEDTGSAVLKFMVKLFGWAAPKIMKKLVRAGGRAGAEPEGFYVVASEGPLREGELERAAAWVRQLA